MVDHGSWGWDTRVLGDAVVNGTLSLADICAKAKTDGPVQGGLSIPGQDTWSHQAAISGGH